MSEKARFFSYTREEFLDEFAHPDDRPAVEEAHQRSEEVKLNRGNDRISQLAGRPDIAATSPRSVLPWPKRTGYAPCSSLPGSPKLSPVRADERVALQSVLTAVREPRPSCFLRGLAHLKKPHPQGSPP
jgi:hypothetical protein